MSFQRSSFQNSAFQVGARPSNPVAADTSDPVFYDWWRKRRKEQEEKPEPEIAADEPQSPVIERAIAKLRPETLIGIDQSKSLAEIRAISAELKAAERRALDIIIAEYERIAADEDDIETMLLLL